MVGKIVKLLFSITILNIFSLTAYTATDTLPVSGVLNTPLEANSNKSPNKNPDELFAMEIKPKASYWDRSHKYHLLNVGNWATNAFGYFIDFDMHDWAPGYEVSLGTAKDKPVGIVTSFEQSFTSSRDIKEGFPGQAGLGLNTLLAYIDGSLDSIGRRGCSANDNTALGKSTHRFNYDFQYSRINLNFTREIVNNNKFKMAAFTGPVYARFNQNYNVTTTGWSVYNTDPILTNTSEKLKDDLYGQEIGLNGRINISNGFYFDFIESADFFYCYSTLDAVQNITNGSGPGQPDRLPPVVDRSLSITKDRGSFVPYIKTNIAATWDISRNVTFSLFYRLDLWYNLSRIVNPTLSGNYYTSTGAAYIDNGERLFVNNIGGNLKIKF